MTVTPPPISRAPRRIAAGLGLAAVLLAGTGLSGCATAPGGARLEGDPVTESDETPERRRARIRLELAAGYFEEGRTEIALDEIKQVLASDPSFAPAYNLRGLIYMRLNDARQAEESFRRAIALDGRDGDTFHNYGWLLCQTGRDRDAMAAFERGLANPLYAGRAKTLMAQGICHARSGRLAEAEASLGRSYELDAANPVTGYNLARLLFQRGELTRAQFYIRRLNNSEYANAETLWLGIRVEQRLGDRIAMGQLADQLRKRYPQSPELAAYDRGAFNE